MIGIQIPQSIRSSSASSSSIDHSICETTSNFNVACRLLVVAKIVAGILTGRAGNVCVMTTGAGCGIGSGFGCLRGGAG
jgi:hypothetical protein